VVVTIYKYTTENNLTKKRGKKEKRNTHTYTRPLRRLLSQKWDPIQPVCKHNPCVSLIPTIMQSLFVHVLNDKECILMSSTNEYFKRLTIEHSCAAKAESQTAVGRYFRTRFVKLSRGGRRDGTRAYCTERSWLACAVSVAAAVDAEANYGRRATVEAAGRRAPKLSRDKSNFCFR